MAPDGYQYGKWPTLGLYAISILLIALLFWLAYESPYRFNSDRWKQWDFWRSPWDQRRKMVADLRENVLQAGMAKKDIQTLLGPPSDDYSTHSTWIIFVAYSDYADVSEGLQLKFDGDDRLLEFQIVELWQYRLDGPDLSVKPARPTSQ